MEYLTRFMLLRDKKKAFIEPMSGAEIAEATLKGMLNDAKTYLRGIRGLMNASIENACKLATFKAYFSILRL